MTCHFLGPHAFEKPFYHNSAVTIITRMVSSKREIGHIKADSEKRRMSRAGKLLCWLFVDLVVAAVVIGLLLHKPGGYNPIDFDSASYEPGQVSPYLTHELSPRIYNGAQRGQPFDVLITQKGINEIVASWGWPKMSQGVMLYSPAVLFKPGSALLMATASVKGAEFVVTIEIKPRIDEKGLLSFHVSKVKIGAMNITPIAKLTAKKMYLQRIANVPIDEEAIQTKIAESLLSDASFEPVFKVDDRKVRIDRITVGKEKLKAHLVPAS